MCFLYNLCTLSMFPYSCLQYNSCDFHFRQCMCCYRDLRNFERFNNLVQVILNKGISFIQTLPKDCQDAQFEQRNVKFIQENKDIAEKDQEAPNIVNSETVHCNNVESKADVCSDAEEECKSLDQFQTEKIEDVWTLEEKDRLFNFVAKVFLMNFPVYVAYKHTVNTTLDELSQQEAAALNNYCELNVSILLMHSIK